MYTELVLKCTIKEDTPEEILKILRFLFTEHTDEVPTHLPDHPFFNLSDWDLIGRSSSYYHIPKPLNFFDKHYLFSRSDLKNYRRQIECFIDWINPYIDVKEADCIGWLWYEEDAKPTLIFK